MKRMTRLIAVLFSISLFTGIESKDNIRLYKKNGYIEHEIKVLNDHISLQYLIKTK